MHVVCLYCHKTNRVPEEKISKEPHCGVCGDLLFAGKPVEFGFAELQRHVQKSEMPVLVDFWAPWCGPCRVMAPAFAEAAAQLKLKVRAAKVNTEEDQQAGMIHGIRSIPTMILFHGGQEVERVSGAMSAAQIVNWVNASLA